MKPTGHVWKRFEELSRIPRQSKQEQQVREWLIGIADGKGLAHRSDATGNMVIAVPATAGYEASPGVVLQAHMDMVCEKRSGVKHDFSSDPIRLVRKADGWLYADGTTLGADNGIGLSLALAVLDTPELQHPPLELLFTVDEETGLTGASDLEPGILSARRLINLDSSDEGIFTIGCAGGLQTDIVLPLTWEPVEQSLTAQQVCLRGLSGGHSGVNIHEQRANAISELARVLYRMSSNIAFKLVRFTGGNAHNAIPRDAEAVILLQVTAVEELITQLAQAKKDFMSTYGATDPRAAFTVEETQQVAKGLNAEANRNVLALLTSLPHGVQRMSSEFNGVVETSCNLAKADLSPEGGSLRAMLSQRSFNPAALQAITGRIHATAALAGASASDSNGYPAWQPREDSELMPPARQVYREVSGKDARVEVIHAGLECGLIGDKHPGMDMISFGPNIEHLHSPDERVEIESVNRTWAFLCALLAKLK